jgi:signal transduction histidine kinase
MVARSRGRRASMESLLLDLARAPSPGAALGVLAEAGIIAAWLDADGQLRQGEPALLGVAQSELAAAGAPDGLPATDRAAEVVTLSLEGGEHLLCRWSEDVPASAWEPIGDEFRRAAAREERLHQLEHEMAELRQRAEESEALHVLGLSANRTLEAEAVVDLVARFSRSLLGGHYVTVTVTEDGRVRTARRAGVRSDGFPEADPLGVAVIEGGKPLVVPPDPTGLDLDAHRREGMRAVLGVPMSLYGESIGALVVGYRREYEPTGRDVRLALTLAGHAAVALHNARLHGELATRQAELERTYAELRWSSEAKERFFATLSHELRTPLNSTLGYLDLVLDEIHGPVPEALRTPLKAASRSAKGLLHLVNDVLDLAKIDAGKVEISLRPTRIGAVAREAAATIEPLAAARGLALELTIEEALPPVQTDADRVRQILINLLSNAIKFTSHGEVRLDVKRSGSLLEVRVTDSGIGIGAEDVERIFHEFEQVAGGGIDAGGTGLGLPISRKLARLLGGDVRVQSQPGAGSAFTLQLPLG